MSKKPRIAFKDTYAAKAEIKKLILEKIPEVAGEPMSCDVGVDMSCWAAVGSKTLRFHFRYEDDRRTHYPWVSVKTVLYGDEWNGTVWVREPKGERIDEADLPCKYEHDLLEGAQLVINCTLDDVFICDKDGGTLRVIEPNGPLLRVSAVTKPAGEHDGIPLSKTTYGEIIGLPDPHDGALYIVPKTVKSARPDRKDLVVPAEPVCNLDVDLIGYRSLGV